MTTVTPAERRILTIGFFGHPCRGKLVSRRDYFIADQRGAAALEILFVYPLLMFALFLPLADVAIAGFRYISAWEALRAFGQYIQYNQPPDPTAPTWTPALQMTVGGHTIGNLHVRCGDATVPTDCNSGNTTLTLPNGS